MSIERKLRALAERWVSAAAAERANAQSYVIELCEALEVERPRPAGSGYEFEYPVPIVNRDGTETTNFVDLYKRGFFVLEAKDQTSPEADTLLLRKAYGQARAYAGSVDGGPPPFLMVLDVGRTLLLWDRWSGAYGGFSAAAKINLATLSTNSDEIGLLRDVFENPEARNPNLRAAAVTKDIAVQLGNLASSLEDRGFEQERVARFLIRCVFTMFAEDTELIPDAPFTRAIDDIGFTDPSEFSTALAELWRAMDEGSRFGLKKFLRFNGHFFRDQEVLALTREDLVILRLAAESRWDMVEPSIMGTLLVRALDPAERHKLGAEFTPREHVERVVRPTVEEPIRERWTAVQADVLQLSNPAGKSERTRREHERLALERLRAFHDWLRGLSFLDPACGSGNFLYVTLAIVKQIELELLRAIEEVTGAPELAVEEVGPWQFHGIEVKLWAREIAELTLWIGYHQWWRRTHGHTQPPEPVLRDTGTLEHRDAVLQWTAITENVARARPDPTPRIRHPATGRLVPDPAVTLRYFVHENAHPAPWPQADFIVGNPPYMGLSRQRDVFGDGYVDALRAAYPEVPDTADYVMYWWYRAAKEVSAGRCTRAGLITTNSITQTQNRSLIEAAAQEGARITWAIPDHPWVNDDDAAAVRVAMTVIANNPRGASLIRVNGEGVQVNEHHVRALNSDLTVHADVATAAAVPLFANRKLAHRGFQLIGSGFIVGPQEVGSLLNADPAHAAIVKPYRHGRDLTGRPRGVYLIDFGMRQEEEARQFPVLFDVVRTRVKPERDANNRPAYRNFWWRFGEPRREFREAVEGLNRYIATVETAKHRFFTFLPAEVAPDNMLVLIGSDDAFHLGVLSSALHVTWALAAGGTLEDRPRYNKTRCFDSFPFPEVHDIQRQRIARTAEQLDQHRKDALARDDRVTMTGMYNVLEKLRSHAELTESERDIHTLAACGVLQELHDELDSIVADAYGIEWPADHDTVLLHLVKLHDERVAEERAGHVRWLRPEYQYPTAEITEVVPELGIEEAASVQVAAQIPAWPTTTVEQIAALQSLLARTPVTVEEAAQQFRGARRDIVARHLETLALMGEARALPDGAFQLVKQPA